MMAYLDIQHGGFRVWEYLRILCGGWKRIPGWTLNLYVFPKDSAGVVSGIHGKADLVAGIRYTDDVVKNSSLVV